MGIYGLRNTTNGKWYVGQSAISIGERWNRYRLCRCKHQRKLYHALLKYGYDAFEKVVLEECIPTTEVLDAREAYWSAYYDSIENGYNIAPPGSSHRLSEETKAILREKATGRKHSDTARQKMRENHNYTQRPRTEETTKKLIIALTGKKRSSEVCQKFRKAFRNRPPRKKTEEEKEKIRQSMIRIWQERRTST